MDSLLPAETCPITGMRAIFGHNLIQLIRFLGNSQCIAKKR
ncbi:hypothetical protein TREAZ_0487 [Leadbettera azotonutricia ZAS-9]|uniref:Uncharacterized protein n=1 Tax=Leadbettera azotonutricia (strain ATCC BAA-888 / DSM 13862 / ZAS-9) TaxID=545695 RepID=F5YC85_LEAAZ|nr:hypothetical protein TREAZ_0487 [Leadbettera azotonutricia ZAS-9]